MTLTDFEIDVLRVFYRPDMNLCQRINRPENFERRKAAVHRLLDAGLIEDLGGFSMRITHAGHTLLDGLDAAE